MSQKSPPAMRAGPKGIIFPNPRRPRTAMRMVKIQEKRTMTKSEGAPKVAPRTASRSTSPMPIASRGMVAEVVFPSSDLRFSISNFSPSTRMWSSLISNHFAVRVMPSMLSSVTPLRIILSVLRKKMSDQGMTSSPMTKHISSS